MKFFDKIKSWFAAVWQKLTGKNKSDNAQEEGNPEATIASNEKKTDMKKVKGKTKGQGNTFVFICQWIFKLRSLFMAIPVIFAAIIIAIHNSTHLPEKIAVYFPTVFANDMVVKMTELDRGTAVSIPLLITGACLALMCCSRRTIYPWIISIFSLVLPLFFLFVGMYPV